MILCLFRSVLVGVLLVPTAFAGSAMAESGLQITPDDSCTLVSKDVADQRWVITLNADDGTATGNVFFPAGGDSRFVACHQTASSEEMLTFACAGADRCPLAPCTQDEWAPIGEVTIPRSFFRPRSSSTLGAEFTTAITGSGRLVSDRAGGGPADGSGSAVPTLQIVARRLGSAEHPLVAARPSGLQVTGDGKRTLISKDVGDERWAISRNGDDGSATGNVFFPAGGEPKFVWCGQEGAAGDDLVFSCSGADACRDTICGPEQWSYIAQVQLPASFFSPPARVRLEDLEVTVLATLGGDDGFYGIALALDRGYSLRQVLRAALSGRLQTDGSVVMKTGGLEPPEGPAHGILAAAGVSSALTLPLATGPAPNPKPTPSRLIRHLLEKADLVAGVRSRYGLCVLISLASQGYSLEQIVQGILFDRVKFGRVSIGTNNRIELVEIVDDSGGLLYPDGPPSDLVVPLSSPTPTPRPTQTPVGEVCGNGVAGGDEECDGGDLRGATCQALGFAHGTLGCTSRCIYYVVDCSDEPSCTEQRCPDGACVPRGSDCCGGGRYCRPGSLCVGGGKCCPAASPQLCGTLCVSAETECCGGYYCNPGFVCASGGGCCPEGLPQPCPDGTCTIAGYVCCGGGTSCPPGQACTQDGTCE
jgi:hypothetical protein